MLLVEESRCWTGLPAVQTFPKLNNIWSTMKRIMSQRQARTIEQLKLNIRRQQDIIPLHLLIFFHNIFQLLFATTCISFFKFSAYHSKTKYRDRTKSNKRYPVEHHCSLTTHKITLGLFMRISIFKHCWLFIQLSCWQQTLLRRNKWSKDTWLNWFFISNNKTHHIHTWDLCIIQCW